MKRAPSRPYVDSARADDRESAIDVRRLCECAVCHRLGIDLIRGLFKGSIVERGKPIFVHAYCLISYAAYVVLKAEFGK
jgi:hypothetical protein